MTCTAPLPLFLDQPSTSSAASNTGVGQGEEHTMGENWILGPKPPMAFPSSPPDMLPPRPSGLPPPPPSQAPPSIQSPPPSTPTQQQGAQRGHSPALPGLGRPATPISSPNAVPNQAGFSLNPVGEVCRASTTSSARPKLIDPKRN